MQHTATIDEFFALQVLRAEVPEDIWKELPKELDPGLSVLLYTYRIVFQTPSGLPL